MTLTMLNIPEIIKLREEVTSIKETNTVHIGKHTIEFQFVQSAHYLQSKVATHYMLSGNIKAVVTVGLINATRTQLTIICLHEVSHVLDHIYKRKLYELADVEASAWLKTYKMGMEYGLTESITSVLVKALSISNHDTAIKTLNLIGEGLDKLCTIYNSDNYNFIVDWVIRKVSSLTLPENF